MIYTEKEKDLFSMHESYYLAHCISRDCKMGAGIAVDFQEKFDLRETLLNLDRDIPDCIKVDRVFNLITKEKYWQKPTMGSVRASLEKMRDIALSEGVKKIAMPRIGSGLDRLKWHDVRGMIIEVFNDTEIEIFVCVK